ncbi:MAG: hypothetical protein R2755_23605 [Acidimicrobiales bacterium]
MRIVRFGEGADGTCHASEVEITYAADAATGLAMSESLTSDGMQFVTLPDGFAAGLHPSAKRRVLVVLRGQIEVGVPDGSSRVFGPGDSFIVDDAATSGHTTRTIGGAVEMLWVAIPDTAVWRSV